jgi:hypothetical protein
MRSTVRVAGWQLGAVAAVLAAAGDLGWRSGGVVASGSGRGWRALDLVGDGDLARKWPSDLVGDGERRMWTGEKRRWTTGMGQSGGREAAHWFHLEDKEWVWKGERPIEYLGF